MSSSILYDLSKFSGIIILLLVIILVIYFEKRRQKKIKEFCHKNGFQYINTNNDAEVLKSLKKFKTHFVEAKLSFTGLLLGKKIKFLECYKVHRMSRRNRRRYSVILFDSLENKLPKFSIDYNVLGMKGLTKFLGLKSTMFPNYPTFNSKYQVFMDGKPKTMKFFERIIPYFESKLPKISLDSNGENFMLFSFNGKETNLYQDGVKYNVEDLLKIIFNSWNSISEPSDYSSKFSSTSEGSNVSEYKNTYDKKNSLF